MRVYSQIPADIDPRSVLLSSGGTAERRWNFTKPRVQIALSRSFIPFVSLESLGRPPRSILFLRISRLSFSDAGKQRIVRRARTGRS